MDSISSLRSILITALSTSGIQEGGEQELFDELTLSKTRLLKVFDYGPRSPQEQRELDQGAITLTCLISHSDIFSRKDRNR